MPLKLARDAALIFAITAALLELSARALTCWQGSCHIPPAESYRKAKEELSPRGQSQSWKPVAHPFFGYVAQDPKANNAGFFSKEDFPYRKKGNEYVIGLFGGSVATQVFAAITAPELQEELRRVPWLKNRSIVWLNFSMGCMGQPQQFIISSFYNETLDLSVNLDGYNEIGIHYRGYPATEPCFYRELFSDAANAQRDRIRARRIRKWQMQATELMLDHPLLTKSAFFHLAWKGLRQWGAREIQEIRSIARPAPNFHPETEEEEGAALVKNWEKFTRLQSNIASRIGLPSIFLLQPNQHLKGSKPLAPEEYRLLENTDESPARREHIHHRLSELRKGVSRLRSQGVNAVDLTDTFLLHPEPLYVDDCCHLNDRGTQLLAKRIVREIVGQMLHGKLEPKNNRAAL